MNKAQLSLVIPERHDSDRLLFEPYRPGDGAWLHAALERSRDHLAASLAQLRNGMGLDLTDPHEAELFVRRMSLDWAARSRFVLPYRERGSGSFVGDLWIECSDWSVPLFEIGYFVVEEHLGKGYATEAARAGLRFVFERLGAAKVRLTCDADNVGSYRVAERCGFTLEGRLRSEVARDDGESVDRLHYGMLRAEYEALAG
jgi:RimJ/RimL family protein N-acetyltransferase